MRLALLLTLAMALPAAQEPPEPAKQAPSAGNLGRVVWFDITTTDLKKSADFYRQLFGWTITITPGNDQFAYIEVQGTRIGNLRVADGPISMGDGVVYIQVADIRQGSAKAAKLGGTIAPGFPFDLPDGSGAISLIKDPCGHPIGMFSPTPMLTRKPAAK